jgi:hypothetical protein
MRRSRSQWMRCHLPGIVSIGLGLIATAWWLFFIPLSRVAIFDSVGFGTSEGLEARGVLGPWRPASTADMAGGATLPELPAERYLARDGWVDAKLHRVYLTVLRDREGTRRDTVTRIKPVWRKGWAAFVIAGSTLGPLAMGLFWIFRAGRRRMLPESILQNTDSDSCTRSDAVT